MADINQIAGFADRYKNFFNVAGVVVAALGGVYLGIARSNIEARYLIKEVAVNARQDNNELRMTVDRFVNSVDRQMAIYEKRLSDTEKEIEKQRLETREDMQHLRGYKTR